MKVKIRVHHSFINTPMCGYNGEKDIGEGKTGKDLIRILGINSYTCFLLINSKLASMDNVLMDGDRVEVFPVIIGG